MAGKDRKFSLFNFCTPNHEEKRKTSLFDMLPVPDILPLIVKNTDEGDEIPQELSTTGITIPVKTLLVIDDLEEDW